MEYVEDFCFLMNEYTSYLMLNNTHFVLDICKVIFHDLPFCNLHIFRNIIFPDPVHMAQISSLEKKMEKILFGEEILSGTGFNNPENVFDGFFRPKYVCKIGIHLHLYNIYMAHEIVRYLQDFPVNFDLYITITEKLYIRTIENLFSRSFIKNINKLSVLLVENRGRDIAPWILNMRNYQASYDLFCHIHSKASTYSNYGNEWRTYLFDNIIRKDAVSDIINIFSEHPDMGCVFPAMFSKLRQTFLDFNVPLYGSEYEYSLICNMLHRMGLTGELCRSELFFSGGSMMWYRPQALHQLFTVDLELDEFAEEPIGVGGTLAHALERLPSVVAMRNGYTVKTVTRRFA